jgi:hypothetical protein
MSKTIEKVEKFVKVLQLSKSMQKRFVLISPQHLNKVTVVGIRDMSLGKTDKHGLTVGKKLQ